MDNNRNVERQKPSTTSWFIMLMAILFSNLLNVVHAEQVVTYYHTDVLGSVVAASDQSGSLMWRKSYMPYGEKNDDGEGKNNALAYTGKPHDDVTGLTYMGARYYDPDVGRFMAMDPVDFNEGNPLSFNRYAYANNNPYKYVDPDGRVSIKAWYGPTGSITEGKNDWRLNVQLTTSDFEYINKKARKYISSSVKGLVKKVIKNELKKELFGSPVGPRGDGDNMSDVVAVDQALVENGFRESRNIYSHDIKPEDFINAVNNMDSKSSKLFKSVHGQSARDMVEEAKKNYNNSLRNKIDDNFR